MRYILIALLTIGSLFSQIALSPGKCPVCAKRHLESKVFPGGGSTTAAYCQPFYDEKGAYHSHECNTSAWSYRCSRGHQWQVFDHGSDCPAGDHKVMPPEVVIVSEKDSEESPAGPLNPIAVESHTATAESFIIASDNNTVALSECGADRISLDPKIEKGEVVMHARICKDGHWVTAKIRIGK